MDYTKYESDLQEAISSLLATDFFCMVVHLTDQNRMQATISGPEDQHPLKFSLSWPLPDLEPIPERAWMIVSEYWRMKGIEARIYR